MISKLNIERQINFRIQENFANLEVMYVSVKWPDESFMRIREKNIRASKRRDVNLEYNFKTLFVY